MKELETSIHASTTKMKIENSWYHDLRLETFKDLKINLN